MTVKSVIKKIILKIQYTEEKQSHTKIMGKKLFSEKFKWKIQDNKEIHHVQDSKPANDKYKWEERHYQWSRELE